MTKIQYINVFKLSIVDEETLFNNNIREMYIKRAKDVELTFAESFILYMRKTIFLCNFCVNFYCETTFT